MKMHELINKLIDIVCRPGDEVIIVIEDGTYYKIDRIENWEEDSKTGYIDIIAGEKIDF